MNHALWHEINRFLIFEARLLDERRFEEWLDLFAEGAFNTAFVPLFAKQLEGGGRGAARRFAELRGMGVFERE